MNVENLLNQYYKEFVGLPNEHPIVRLNQIADAYPLVVLDIIYGKSLDFSIEKNNISEVCNYIVAPPDSGIDMVIERDLGDEYAYDFIQVKYSDLADVKIRECFSTMKRTIDTYLKHPEILSKNLLSVLSKTQFDSNAKTRSTYYVIHNGNKNSCIGIADDEKVIGSVGLEEIYNSSQGHIPKVKYDVLKSDSVNNFSMYSDNAYLINIRGYELAVLANKYDSTEVGRNILFGQNLRDSLETKSKTYEAMKKTIDNEPEQFWYYNNGITIVADDIDLKAEDGSNITGQIDSTTRVDKVILRDFSIINGAQTTSSLGKYLNDATDKAIAEEKLKKVFVFARILKVVDEKTGNNIAIYNNSQNPITTRDMVSNNSEQIMLKEKLFKESPQIYMETRRGTHIPPQPKILQHRRTTNEELAQLSYAGFLQKPFVAKDKKKSLFNKDYSDNNYVINEYYDKIFKYDVNASGCNGILFEKTNMEIDELLFVKHLYKEANKFLKARNNAKIAEMKHKLENKSDPMSSTYEQNIVRAKRNSEISNISLFYVIAYYYYVRSIVPYHFDIDVEKYYSDKLFKEGLIKQFCDLYLSKTIRIIDKLATENSSASAASWIRASKSQTAFLEEIANVVNMDYDYEEKIQEFIAKYSKCESLV